MDPNQFTVWNITQASQSGNVMLALKLSLALAKAVQATDLHQRLMVIWNKTDEKVLLPFSWTWHQYGRIKGSALSDTIYLDSDEFMDKSISAAEVIYVIDNIDREILELVHEMTQRAKIDIDVTSLQVDQKSMI